MEFQGTYPEFRGRLLEHYPTLTKMEVKICSLLKLHLSTADIATMLCLSERTVDGHRMHIRKKLGIGSRDDLAEAVARI